MVSGKSRFKDKVVLVTGGTSGMGLATTRLLLTEGAHVIVAALDDQLLATLPDSLENVDRVRAIPCDVANLHDLDGVMARVEEHYGRLDVVFANAGVASFMPIDQVTEAEFARVTDVNFKGVYFTIQKALPLLSQGGAIVINASWTVHRGAPAISLYSATKAAAHNLTHTLAAELATRGIRVNSVSPGYIETPMFHRTVAPDAHADIISQVVAGRLGTEADVAATVAFLASDDATYINGQDLIVDGGLIAAIPGTMV